MSLSLFEKRFLFFGGKGGVGKTTMAAATAIRAADLGLRTLLVSTDPAHSVSDSLDQQIGGETYTQVQNVNNLWAIELNTEEAMRTYSDMISHQDPSGTISEFIGGDDPASLSPPGADETVAFIQLLEFIQNPEYDIVVFDTAPTGHTLKLLQLPEMTQSWLYRLIKMRRRLGGMLTGFKTLFGGSSGPDEQEAFEKLEELRDQVEIARVHLANAKETEFVAVTIPTIMAIWETERLIRALFEVAFPISQIYINQVQPENPDCTYCRARYESQRENLVKIKDLYSEFDLVEIQMFEYEIRGTERLRELSHILYREENR
ncbi:MAG: TRC40/GET3/ArsA family transport-energizing ATPase [Candidatus Heimdallarchaeota archaeon]|nr:MAG: TRC40/GET3/ArsA family transport-energizing ATPase [Candidatus Heimdallarchaeota archaeon]